MSSSLQPLEVRMDGKGAEVVAALPNDETSKQKTADTVMSEEKKQVEPNEENAVAAQAVAAKRAEKVPESFQEPSVDVSMMSPNDAPKQTVSGEAALHSSAAAKATSGTKSTVNGSAKEKNQDAVGGADQETSTSNHAHQANNDDEDSSNDDSSYFADPNNLPVPGEGGRKYSYSSHHSTTRNNAKGRESDASLSLSEDSDDANNQGNNVAIYGQREAPEVFPQQRITRMHSVGSLVSTSSQNTEDDFGNRREFYHRGKNRPYDGQGPDNSGRVAQGGPHLMYPAHGQHQQYPQGPPTSFVPDNRQYQFPQNYPQPQILGQEQWMAAARAESNNMPPNSGGIMDGSMQYNEEGGVRGVNGSSLYQNNGGGSATGKKPSSRRAPREGKRRNKGRDEPPNPEPQEDHMDGDGNFKVYWQRWIMLMYMSILNLLVSAICLIHRGHLM